MDINEHTAYILYHFIHKTVETMQIFPWIKHLFTAVYDTGFIALHSYNVSLPVNGKMCPQVTLQTPELVKTYCIFFNGPVFKIY